jgi:hypothetical protein
MSSSNDRAAPDAAEWETSGRSLIRHPVPGGWLYAIGSYDPQAQSLDIRSCAVTFVPEEQPRGDAAEAAPKPDPALAADFAAWAHGETLTDTRPERVSAEAVGARTAIIAYETEEGERVIWTRGARPALNTLAYAVGEHVAEG